MLYLVFAVGENRLALPASRVAEVLPLVRIERVPGAAASIAGFFNFRGAYVPVLDLCQLILKRPAQNCLSSRIILVEFLDRERKPRLAGLLAEQATETLQKSPEDFLESGVVSATMPFLGPVTRDEHGFIHQLVPERFLSQQAADMLAYLPPEVRP